MTLGLTNTKLVEIKSGLREGDKVIYAGTEDLAEGAPVVPTQWGPSGPLALPPATGDVAAGMLYTCPMHPRVRQDHPGDCPICGMRLRPTQRVPAPASRTPGNPPEPSPAPPPGTPTRPAAPGSSSGTRPGMGGTR